MSSWIQRHSHQANSLSDTHWSNCTMLSVDVHGIFLSRPPHILTPPASAPPLFPSPQYCPIHSTQEASNGTCFCAFIRAAWCGGHLWPGLSGQPSQYQACWKFGLLAQTPPHHNFMFPNLSCLKYIKSSVLCEKIDVVNKELTYVINVLAHIITLLSFLFFVSLLKSFWLFLLGASADSSSPMIFHHINQHPSASGNKLRHWFHPGHHPSKCTHHGKKFQKDS